MNRAAGRSTFLAMASTRLLRSLVLLALPLVVGAAGSRALAGAVHPMAADARRPLSATGPVVPLPGGSSAGARAAGLPSAGVAALSPVRHPAAPAGPSAAVARALAASLTGSDAVARASLVPLGSLASISAPRQSLPPPVHDEATCAFCQAAIFPPCAPQPVAVSLELLGLVRGDRAPADAAAPQFSTHRRTSSRAPPTLRSI